MTFVRTALSVAAVTAAIFSTSAQAANDKQQDSYQPVATSGVQIAQAPSGNAAMGMGGMATAPGHADQMKAIQQMHERMLAAKTPAERNALMAEQMKLMQNGMKLMGGMGGMSGMGADAAPGKPTDMAARQGMMEQRMDMMQSMMQMMVDRMQSVPVTK